MAPEIREYSAADYERVAELWQASGIRVESEEDLRLKLRRDPDLFLVAEEKGEVVGALLGAFDGRIGSINRLAVAESQRRGGLATRMISTAEERLAAKGARRVWAWIEGHNAASRALFGRAGYEEWTNVVTATKVLPPAAS